MSNSMHDGFKSRSTIRVWEISVCPLDFPPLISSVGEPLWCLMYLVPRIMYLVPRMGTEVQYNNISVFILV